MLTKQCSPHHRHNPLSSVKIWAHHVVTELKVRGSFLVGRRRGFLTLPNHAKKQTTSVDDM